MKKYLVQYGLYNEARLVEANSEEDAIRVAFNGFMQGSDYDYDVLVIELPKGYLYTVDRSMEIKRK